MRVLIWTIGLSLLGCGQARVVTHDATSARAVEQAPPSPTEVTGATMAQEADRAEPTEPSPDPDSVLRRFSWVINTDLAGLARPDAVAPLDQSLPALRALGVRMLVSLTEHPPDPALVRAHDMTPLHLPVQDFTAPTQEQIGILVTEVQASIAAGNPVAVHCTAGLGRTGTMLAAYFVSLGRSASEAIDEVRTLRPGSIETAAQIAAIEEYEASLAQP